MRTKEWSYGNRLNSLFPDAQSRKYRLGSYHFQIEDDSHSLSLKDADNNEERESQTAPKEKDGYVLVLFPPLSNAS